jgi:molybdopterin-binding protein
LIEIAITKQLGSFALDVTLAAPESGVTALFGRSGVGKTSVINALAGLLRPDRGRIACGGTVLFDSERGIDLPPERRRLGYVFQEARLFPHYSVRGNLLYGAKSDSDHPGPSVDAVIDLLGIKHLLARRPSDLSGSVEALTSRLDLWPLTGRYEAGAVIRTVLSGHDTAYGLSELDFPGGRLRVPQLALPLGTAIRVRIHARDVVIATKPPAHLSIRNAFAGTVIELAPPRGPLIDLKLDIGTPSEPVMLWARITQRALEDLQLVAGKPVFALVKTVALDRHSLGQYEDREAEAL